VQMNEIDFHDVADEARRFLSLPRPTSRTCCGRPSISSTAPTISGLTVSSTRTYQQFKPASRASTIWLAAQIRDDSRHQAEDARKLGMGARSDAVCRSESAGCRGVVVTTEDLNP
jgi:hypothetical protein